MTELIENLVRRLDAAQCVYELMVMNPGAIRVNTYAESFHRAAASVAAHVAVQLKHDYSVEVVLVTIPRLQHYVCLACGATFLSSDKVAPICEKCGIPT